MKILLGEFTIGACKGFRYYYPQLELELDITFHPSLQLQQEQLLHILNVALKGEYSRHVSETKAPIKVIGKGLSPEAAKAVGEALAKQYPDGILNDKETLLTLTPWQLK